MRTNKMPGDRQEDSTAKPKVVRVIARMNVGGPARQACILHERLTPNFETRLITGALAEGEQDMSYLLSSERNVLRLPQMSREIAFINDAMAFGKMVRFLQHERPDVVHTHTAKAGALGRLAAWLCRVPVIVHTYHGHVFTGYFGAWKNRVYLAIERLMGRISTQIIAISESQLQELCSEYRVVPRHKICVVNNGFDLSPSLASREEARQRFGFTSDHFVAVWAARMVPVKDVGLLGELIRIACASLYKIRFLVVGDGEERQKLEVVIDGCKNANLIGWQKDMDLVWAAADLAILTSRNEGTPTALIEAMAAGKPYVATDVGGVRDLAVGPLSVLPRGMGYRAQNGFLTAQTPQALLYGIEQMAEDAKAAERMASVGQAFVLQRFSANRLVENLNTLYQSLLTKRRKGAIATFTNSETSS